MSVIHMLQGEMVNRIETHINQSTDYVEKAKDNTARAIKFQNKARKVRFGFKHTQTKFTNS